MAAAGANVLIKPERELEVAPISSCPVADMLKASAWSATTTSRCDASGAGQEVESSAMRRPRARRCWAVAQSKRKGSLSIVKRAKSFGEQKRDARR
jgi:hypothetical protein